LYTKKRKERVMKKLLSVILVVIILLSTASCNLIQWKTISFDSNDGTALDDILLLEGTPITKPSDPEKEGYAFSGWYFNAALTMFWDFNELVKYDSTLYAKWAPRTDTAYKLEHYQQDVSGTGYTLFATENLTGTTEATVNAVAAAFPGFEENTSHTSRIPSGKILSNGSLVLKLYYNRILYDVGDLGPAGGYIFYDKGGYIGNWRYLEAGPKATEVSIKQWWGGSETNVGETGFAIGDGKGNTDQIVAMLGDVEAYAAKYCADLTYIGFSDWFLPSKAELNLMHLNLYKKSLGRFSAELYWSSSQSSVTASWSQLFRSGSPYSIKKSADIYVRPVRAF
jgi:uncharacterized repeat protein (TIGR02543 family)